MTAASATRWLRVASIATIASGLLAAAASSEVTDGPWLLLFDVVDWPADGHPGRFAAETRAVNAVAGGVMVGWGTLMYLLASLRSGPGTAATPVLLGVLAWFVVDSAGSLLAGMVGNVVLNVGFLALLVPPLLGLRRSEIPVAEQVATAEPARAGRDGLRRDVASLADVAAIAASLPEAVEGERSGTRTWSVGKKAFAWERPFTKADVKRFGSETPPAGAILAVQVGDLS